MNLQEAVNLVEQVKNGEANPLDAYPVLYDMEKSCKELLNELKDFVIEERSKYADKERIVKNGYEISVVTTQRYSFKHDQDWQAYNEKRKQRESLMKKAYKMSEKNQHLQDPETGEVIEPAEVKISTYPKLNYVGHE